MVMTGWAEAAQDKSRNCGRTRRRRAGRERAWADSMRNKFSRVQVAHKSGDGVEGRMFMRGMKTDRNGVGPFVEGGPTGINQSDEDVGFHLAGMARAFTVE